MRYENNDTLREFLDRGAAGDYREHMRHPQFEIDDAAFAAILETVREQHPHLPEDELHARTVFRLLTCGAPPHVVVALPSRWYRLQAWTGRQAPRAWRWLKIAWAVALLLLAAASMLLLSALTARSAPLPAPAPAPEPVNIVPRADAVRALLLRPPSLYPQFAGGAVVSRLQFQNGSNIFVNVSASNRLPVTCDNCSGGGGGGGGGTSSVDESTFTEGATSFTPSGGYYAASPTALTDGQGGTVLLTSKRAFRITAFDSGGTESFTSGNAGYVRFPSAQGVTQSGAWTVAQSGTWNINNISGTVSLPTGAATAAKQPALGTAGSAAADVITVQGIAGMTKLLVTPDANSAVNVAQMNGVTVTMGNGTAGTGVQRNTIASDNSAIANWGQGATSAAVPSGAEYTAGIGSGNLTGITVCDNWTAIDQTTGTQIITGSASKKTYFCAIQLVSATAQNISVMAGTGTVCATSSHKVFGGSTAATGWNLAANGGIAMGSGLGVIAQAATAADNICVLQSGSGQISGSVSWTQY